MFKTELTLTDTGFLFDHGTGLTYTLNSTGQFIFRQIQAGKEATDVLKSMTGEFEVDEDTARKDLDDFYRQMREMGLHN